ncbi:MAG: hypothetical protein HY914_04055 [Desulfomonile tiedjei]|nr:hypothetical protein [Desulfomonile tiedjei]
MKVIPMSQHKRQIRGNGVGTTRISPWRKRAPLSWRRLPLDRRVVWWTAFACAVYGLLTLLHIVVVPALAGYSFWIVLGGLVLLLIATRGR